MLLFSIQRVRLGDNSTDGPPAAATANLGIQTGSAAGNAAVNGVGQNQQYLKAQAKNQADHMDVMASFGNMGKQAQVETQTHIQQLEAIAAGILP